MTEVVPATTTAFDADPERWAEGMQLVGQWLAEHSGNTLTTYADSIGWPYRVTGRKAGEWRGYDAVRQGLGWLAWCHHHGVHLLDAQRLHVLAWIRDVNASSLAKLSRSKMLTAAFSFYTWAGEEGHAETNPAALINRQKQGLHTGNDPSGTRSLTKDEVQAILAAADHDRVAYVRLRSAAVIALLAIGPRVSEVCKAILADMQVMDGVRALHVVQKGGRDHWYPMPPMVCRRIDAYLASRKDVQRLPALRGETGASATPLIATASGGHMKRSEVLTLVKRLAKESGVEDPGSVHPHVFRHSAITEARRQGHATDEIRGFVGHRFSSTTDRYGKHVLALKNSPVWGVAEAFDV